MAHAPYSCMANEPYKLAPTQLMDVARECRRIVLNAERELGKLPRASYLDLVADNIPDVSLDDLRSALVVAGVGY